MIFKWLQFMEELTLMNRQEL